MSRKKSPPPEQSEPVVAAAPLAITAPAQPPVPVIAVIRRDDMDGAPKWITPAGLELIEQWAANGATLKGIAAKLRMDRGTLVECRKRQPEIDERLAIGGGVHETELVDILTEKARGGETVAALFLLKARHGWREGDARDGGAGGQVNVQIILPDSLSPEQYNARLPTVTAQPVIGRGDDEEPVE